VERPGDAADLDRGRAEERLAGDRDLVAGVELWMVGRTPRSPLDVVEPPGVVSVILPVTASDGMSTVTWIAVTAFTGSASEPSFTLDVPSRFEPGIPTFLSPARTNDGRRPSLGSGLNTVGL
jgi:hypothetical protein